ncbi:hypothetical protein [Streptomyces sp. VMFN-G11Ma]|uniref:hypothetical protein n=1 Tax=Streptomyces sp. VMFN-G11Ma TaxID=2135609 RepID=UPI000D4B893A|nr:hypothetical protein [Streptomyces sp. VMFN-G11Ma]PTM91288.1 hypothetical protein C7821_111263 [Streptomyces sp. VMFN-G11Ma]
MSRETDTPSSGPNGHGGAAYPSGTPPYGTPTASDAGAEAGRSAAQPEDRKTETTLTTRIRINIPGSRPIPPVVVRTPVADTERSDETPRTEAPAPAATQAMSTVETPAEPAQPAAEEKTSDWFAPRKSAAPKGGQTGGATNGAGTPGGSPAPNGSGAPGTGAGAPGPGAAPGAPRPGAGRPGGVVGSMSVPGGSRPGGANGAGTRPGGTNGAGLPGATGGPVAPGHGGGTGSFDVTEALNAGPLGNGPRSGDEPRRDELPYFSETDTGTQNGTNGQGGYGAPVGVSDFNAPGGPGSPGPSGPTVGITGEGPLAPPPGNGGPGGPGGPGGMGGPNGAGLGPGGGLSDDTAILTPQKPAPEPGAQGYPAPDNISGHTVTSGIPVVTPGTNSPFGPGGTGEAPVPHTPPRLPEPVAQNVPSSSSKKKQKKGSNKLVLLGTGVVVVAALAYGAGLLMNHSDVPKGTTVLGVDIGGGTRDDAVKKLDEAFGGNVNKPLKLSVGGKTVTLKPDQAGLQLDEQATVGAAAKSDYNPVSVIGSLFGNHRVVDPVMPVDEEKLTAALKSTSASGGSGSMTEGTIQFKSGKAVAVYGKAGKGIDVAKSTEAVESAYRTQVQTGSAPAVAVPTTTQKPTVSDAEVDRMMNEFAKPAMSGIVTIEAGGVQVKFSPQNSLWKFLGVRAVDGKLVEHYDTTALKNLYGGAWDGVLITRGNGKKTPVTPQDVISAMRKPLLGKTPADRVGVIETNAG